MKTNLLSELLSDDFVRAYVTCALWSSTGDDDNPLDDSFSISDLSESALEIALEDCRKFREDNASDIEASCLDNEQQGHDLWLTRNGHGSGFWDRYSDGGIESIACDELTKACRAVGGRDLYVGDDGALYFS